MVHQLAVKFLDALLCSSLQDEVADAHPRLRIMIDGECENVFGGHFSNGTSLRAALANLIDDRFDAQRADTLILYETQFGRSPNTNLHFVQKIG